jgi:integrase
MRWALRAISAALGGPADPLAMDWPAIGYAEVIAARAALGERYKPATANLILSALRGVLREAWRLGQLEAEAYYRAVDVPSVRGRGLQAGRALREEEIGALLRACLDDDRPAGARDAAIVALLAAAGLRRAELAALDLADYDPDTGAVTVREGKGRKARRTYASTAAPYMRQWLAFRGEAPGPLMLPMRRGGRPAWRHLTGHGIWRILRRRAAAAGLRFAPHDLRRTWISTLLDLTDLATVQALAGHANPATTSGYDHRMERARQRAAGLLHLPQVEGHGGHPSEAEG